MAFVFLTLVIESLEWTLSGGCCVLLLCRSTLVIDIGIEVTKLRSLVSCCLYIRALCTSTTIAQRWWISWPLWHSFLIYDRAHRDLTMTISMLFSLAQPLWDLCQQTKSVLRDAKYYHFFPFHWMKLHDVYDSTWTYSIIHPYLCNRINNFPGKRSFSMPHPDINLT